MNSFSLEYGIVRSVYKSESWHECIEHNGLILFLFMFCYHVGLYFVQ